MAYDDGEVTKAPPADGILQIAPVTNKSTHVQGGTIIGAKPANAFAVNMLLDAWAAVIGQPALVTSTVAEIAGAPARSFRDWATDHAAEFRA